MPGYVLNPHRHVKIWFSDNKDLFLIPKNQLRLVQFRAANPTDEITFIYSRNLLSPKAQQDLLTFCEKHTITPLAYEDIKHEFPAADAEFLNYAEEEMKATVENAGGNLASPSDIFRWLQPIYKRGIYSDFDTDINTAGLPPTIPVEGSFLANIGSNAVFEPQSALDLSKHGYDGKFQAAILNQDIFAIPEINPALSSEEQAIYKNKQEADINRAKQHIRAHYKQFCTAVKNVNDRIDDVIYRKFPSHIANAVSQIFHNGVGIDRLMTGSFGTTPIEIRKRLKEIYSDPLLIIPLELKEMFKTKNYLLGLFQNRFKCTLDEAVQAKRIDEIKKFYVESIKQMYIMLSHPSNNEQKKLHIVKVLSTSSVDECVDLILKPYYEQYYKATVVHSSGPYTLISALQSPYFSSDEIATRLYPYALEHYGLHHHFKSKNGVGLNADSTACQTLTSNKVGVVNDQSWTASGREVLQSDEKKMNLAATRIQFWYKAKRNAKKALKPPKKPSP